MLEHCARSGGGRIVRTAVAGAWFSLLLASAAQAQVGISSVLIDNPVNAPNVDGRGSVATNYAIGQVEVTNEQYARFLNAVAVNTDPGGLWDVLMGGDVRGGISRVGVVAPFRYVSRTNMADKPVNFVTWVDAARFCNWLHNGQPSAAQGPGVTDTGAYTIAGTAIVARNPGAEWYLPSENEWYKAAYHDPVDPLADALGTPDYWLYPTRFDAAPTLGLANATGVISNPGNNVANYNFSADWNGQNGHVTTGASAGSGSRSPYATYDQGGDVDELLEPVGPTGGILLRGGGWDAPAVRMQSPSRLGLPLTTYGSTIGFRVAANFVKNTTFSIAPGTVGLPPTPGNAVFAMPDPENLFFSISQIKRDTTNKGNYLNVNSQLNLGLLPGDDLDAVQGPIHRLPTGVYTLTPRFVFSVRPGSQGMPATPVNTRFPFNAADLYQTTPPGHMLVLPQLALGLNPANSAEDLDALTLEPTAPFAAGSRIWLSLKRGSPTLNNNGWSGADILTVVVGTPGTLAVAIPSFQVGLQPADDVDGLCMVEGLDSNADGLFTDPNDIFPRVYFSVDPVSFGFPGTAVAAQAAGNGSAADIFESMGAMANNVIMDNVIDLELLPTDDIDSLEAPDIECNNPPFADFPPGGSPPFGGGPPPNWPPKKPSTKTPLCYTIAICDTDFPRDWKGTIRQDYIDCSVIPPVMRRAEYTECGKGGSKGAAMAKLFKGLKCPSDPTKGLFGAPMVTEMPAGIRALPGNNHPAKVAWRKANLHKDIANDPQADRIIGQVVVWANPLCVPNAKFCPIEISLTNYTISIVLATPAPFMVCDRTISWVGIDSSIVVGGTGVFDMVFGTANAALPNNFIPAVVVGPGSTPFSILESLAQQVRAAGGVAGVLPPIGDDTRYWLAVERTPVDPPVAPDRVTGPVMIEAGSLNAGIPTWYRTSLATTPRDCNGNQIPDSIDIALGFSLDGDNDGIPDECCLCPADFNCSQTVTIQDIFDFLPAFFAQQPRADINHSGLVTVQDVFDFLTVWFTHCL